MIVVNIHGFYYAHIGIYGNLHDSCKRRYTYSLTLSPLATVGLNENRVATKEMCTLLFANRHLYAITVSSLIK